MSCKHSVEKLVESDRYFVYSEKHNNCCLCVAEENGPMSQEDIGKMLGLTKMRICQIEKRAIEKLKKRIHRFM